MVKNTAVTAFLICMTFFAVQGKGIDYKTYSIQVAAFSKVLEDEQFDKVLKQFDNLTNLGYVYETSYLSPTNMVPSKFYLGSYVGMHTAKRVLAKVKRLGYKDAFIVEELQSQNPTVTGHYKVVQLGSYKKLLMKNYKKLSDQVGQGYVSVVYADDGSYKVMLTCFDDGDMTDEVKDAKDNKFGAWKRDIRDVYKIPTPKPAPKKTATKQSATKAPKS